MNATYRVVKSNLTDEEELFGIGIDVVPQLYTVEEFESEFRLYPLGIQTQVIIVPQASPYPDFRLICEQ